METLSNHDHNYKLWSNCLTLRFNWHNLQEKASNMKTTIDYVWLNCEISIITVVNINELQNMWNIIHFGFGLCNIIFSANSWISCVGNPTSLLHGRYILYTKEWYIYIYGVWEQLRNELTFYKFFRWHTLFLWCHT